MIDEKALEKALRTYDDYWANEDTPGEALRCAIEAYLAAAPLPGATCKTCKGRGNIADYIGDDMKCIEVECPACSSAAPLPGAPVAWTSKSEIDDVKTKQRLTAIFLSPVVNDSFKIPFYTAAPDTAQAVAAEREAIATSIQGIQPNGAHLAAFIRARGAKP